MTRGQRDSGTKRRRAVGVLVVAGGLVLLGAGASSADSLSADISEFLSGASPNHSVWLALGGIAAIARGSMVAAAPRDARRGA